MFGLWLSSHYKPSNTDREKESRLGQPAQDLLLERGEGESTGLAVCTAASRVLLEVEAFGNPAKETFLLPRKKYIIWIAKKNVIHLYLIAVDVESVVKKTMTKKRFEILGVGAPECQWCRYQTSNDRLESSMLIGWAH